jgi:hypothetical protein
MLKPENVFFVYLALNDVHSVIDEFALIMVICIFKRNVKCEFCVLGGLFFKNRNSKNNMNRDFFLSLSKHSFADN